jgi:hypothetical protein
MALKKCDQDHFYPLELTSCPFCAPAAATTLLPAKGDHGKTRPQQIPNPGPFNLDPFGPGRVTDALHRGRTFHVYRATLGERTVALKTPAPGLSGDAFFIDGEHRHTSIVVATDQGMGSLNGFQKRLDPLTVATGALLMEAHRIGLTAGAWNHEVLGLGTWDGMSPDWDRSCGSYDEPLDSRFLPVLVMPYHDATPFSALPGSTKRTLFPRMMPALWDALCVLPHGDLSESNILLDRTRNGFHLIDPGVTLSSDLRDRVPRTGYEYLSIFTTNVANYPIVPPFDRTPCWWAAGLANRLSGSTDGDATDWWNAESLAGQGPGRSPAACDLLAVGIIYSRILTGAEMFLGTSLLPTPVWFRHHVEGRQKEEPTEARLIEALSDGYLWATLEKAAATEAEKRLAHALLNLEILERDQLLRLVSEME